MLVFRKSWFIIFMMEKIKKNKVYIVFGVAFVLCLLRAFKGFCWTDESFYLSTADRFYKGDPLLVSEWYRTQLSSVICLPFYALYMLIVGSNTGVILFFRFLYLILSFTTASVAYRTIKKEYPEEVALIIATFIMFYCHLNVTALSYYMMSLDFLLIALFIIYDYKNTKSEKRLIVAGAIFALSVLSLPSFAVFYFGVIIAALLALLIAKVVKLPSFIKDGIDNAKILTVMIYTAIGIMIPAVIFVVYLLLNVSIDGIIAAVPNILVDKEHDFTFRYCLKKFFFSVTDVYGRWTYLGYAMIVGTFLFQKILKKRIVADLIVFADVLLFIVYAIKSYGHTGYIQSALCLFALPIFFLSEKKNHRMFWLFTVSGLSLAMTYSFSSSDFLYVLAIGHFVCAVSCIVFMYDFAKSNYMDKASDKGQDSLMLRRFKRASALMVSLVTLYALCVTIGIRLSSVYRDAPIPKMTAKITYGIAKGLYTTPEHLEYYNDVNEVLSEYFMSDSAGRNSDDTILFSKILPWGYMVSDLKCAYPSTWRATAYNAQQLTDYYELNPGKEPDVILVLEEYYGSYDASGDVEDDHNPNLDEMNDFWKDYIKNEGLKPTKVKCGTLYTR